MAYERAIPDGNVDWLACYVAAAQGVTALAQGAFVRDGVPYLSYSGEPDGAALTAIDAACAACTAPPAPSVTRYATILPSPGLVLDLGHSDAQWNNIYCSSVIQTSDRNQKADIAPLPEGLGLAFVARLQPRTYRMRDGARTHTGFIAQEVADALRAQGDDPGAYAMWCRTVLREDADPHRTGLSLETHTAGELHALRYDELIAPLVLSVHQLADRAADLAERLAKAEAQNAWLTQAVDAIKVLLRAQA